MRLRNPTVASSQAPNHIVVLPDCPIIIFIHQNTNTGTYEITYNNRYKAYLYNSYKI